ncbi:MAG TPA: sulfur carrier protein ThiS [Chthoniobacterales bacterium]|nr:sulfur carrier protein ThiS [Chthoniobacterales bacterium]
MTISLNGEPREVRAARTVSELVAEFALPAPTLLIEHNEIALNRSEWETTPLAEGDRIELLRVTAGG